MNLNLKPAVAAILALSMVTMSANASQDPPPQPPKKHPVKKAAKTPPGPTVEQQIQILRQEMQGQIDGLKSDLADKDAQLKRAQQAASDAQASADRANAAASAQNQAVVDNAAAVNTLQSTVTDLKGNQASLATTVSEETSSIKKAIDSPNVLHYKGITLTPGGFAAAETIYRTKATGGDIPTAFSSLPYEGSDDYLLSEFYGSGRQSRLSVMAEGKTSWGTLRGYVEADFLGTGISSNNNQSNSYVLRQRVVWASAETNSRWKFAGGQMWSMATEDRKGISNDSGDIMVPLTIDPNYVTGFVWTRQYGFRVVKTFKNVAFGIAAENPQLLYTASLAGNTPYAVLGMAGQNGGNYNAAISSSSPTTYIENYTNQKLPDSAGNVVDSPVAEYATVAANTNIANYAFNVAPDVIVKAAVDPGWGHWEVFGIARFAHETVFPGVTTNSTKYGGQKDIATGAVVAAASTTAGAYENSLVLGGIGASMRVPLLPHNGLTFGAKGLVGPGMGRYGATTLSDVTANAAGELEPIHNVSGLFTLESTPTKRLTLYLNYGGDYAGREDYATAAGTTLGAPKAAQTSPGGKWGATWAAPKAAAVGYGSRLLSNSACNTITGGNPVKSARKGAASGCSRSISCGT